MKKTNPLLLCDFYKISHRAQYPQGTEKIYATWTPRATYHETIDYVISFGFQSFIKEYLIEYFNENFFKKDIKEVLEEYQHLMRTTIGNENDIQHVIDLHKLGYLPVKITAIEEGTKVPLRVPMMTIENTDPKFYWVTNFLETLISCELWQSMTSATIAREYKKILTSWAHKTTDNYDYVNFQAHDFSMRGMSSVASAMHSGLGHLTSFTGTDTIPAITYAEDFYGSEKNGLIGTSIPATEHSVACSYGVEDEKEYVRNLIENVYPKGLVSIVGDTWNLWDFITEHLHELKDSIMTRDGKLVVRPDSGDPVKILCGDPTSTDVRIQKGVIELLWDEFGGKTNSKGFKELDSHIGCIYGDAITLQRADEILKQLADKGFASNNVVFGVGSFTYQYNTRDTFGFAMKSTYAEINGIGHKLFKDPITDNGTKKSQKGRVFVAQNIDGVLEMRDGFGKGKDVDSYLNSIHNSLKPLFENGKLLRETTLDEVRSKITKELNLGIFPPTISPKKSIMM
ncbi:MAG: nicotinate phosphoribosyltransferase [Mycoplasma sp.]